jgi:hypothetical protein
MDVLEGAPMLPILFPGAKFMIRERKRAFTLGASIILKGKWMESVDLEGTR